MKRAVSVITTNTLKSEQEENTPKLKKDTFGTVKINRLGLETLDEREITEEDMTIRNSTIVNRSLRSDLRSESHGTSVYENDVDNASMLSSQFKNMKPDPRESTISQATSGLYLGHLMIMKSPAWTIRSSLLMMTFYLI